MKVLILPTIFRISCLPHAQQRMNKWPAAIRPYFAAGLLEITGAGDQKVSLIVNSRHN